MTPPSNDSDLLKIEHIHQKLLKTKDFEYQYILIQHKTHCQCFLDNIKYSVELSKIALQSVFVLNGAGLIPIVYSKVEYLYMPGLLFAWGALTAALAACFAYLYQYMIVETWRGDVFKSPGSPSPEAYELGLFGLQISFRAITRLRGLAFVCILISFSLFAYGLVLVQKNIDQPNNTPVKEIQKEQAPQKMQTINAPTKGS